MEGVLQKRVILCEISFKRQYPQPVKKSLLLDPDNVLIDSFGGDSWLPKEVELNINSRLKAYGLN